MQQVIDYDRPDPGEHCSKSSITIGRIPVSLDLYLLTLDQLLQLNSSFTEKSSVNFSLGKLTKNRLQIRRYYETNLKHLTKKKPRQSKDETGEVQGDTQKRAYHIIK